MKRRFLTRPLQNFLRTIIRHPKYRWWVVMGALLYFISPIDIAPDALPILGWIDDGAIATLLVAEAVQVLLEQSKSWKTKNSSTSTAKTDEATINVNAVSIS